MIVFIIMYAAGILVTGEVCLIEFWYDDKHKTPVISALVTAVLWPLFMVSYIWVSAKKFARYMMSELSELR